MQVAPNGRTFFIDHAARRTTWIDPRNGRASPMPNQTRRVEDDLGPLPEGWEERVHTDGRVFYIDHSKLIVCFLIFFFYTDIYCNIYRYADNTMGRSETLKS